MPLVTALMPLVMSLQSP